MVGEFANGQELLDALDELEPEVCVLDVEMRA